MATKNLVDVSNLMRSSAAPTAPALPGVHGRRPVEVSPQPDAADETDAGEGTQENPEAEQPTKEAAKDEAEDVASSEAAPSEEPKGASSKSSTSETPDETNESAEEESTPKEAPAPKRKQAAKKSSTKKAPPRKKTETASPAAKSDDAAADPDELVSLDGRPARLWDTSDGQELPEGWARIAVERVHKASRRFRADRRNTTLPDNIYSACNDFIYEEARSGGLTLTLSNLAEAAYEQIPLDDVEGINRLLDTLPDQYFQKELATRPRTFQLLEPTLAHMQNLARMLRAQGFTGKTGLVQTAALRQLLIDLGVPVD